MATLNELTDALRENLEGRGTLRKIRAELRAEIFQALDDKQGVQRPAVPDENLLINELIREYLSFNKYRNTLSVLVTETGQPATPLDRDFLADRTGTVEDGQSRQLCACAPSPHSILPGWPRRSRRRLGASLTAPRARELVFVRIRAKPESTNRLSRPLLYTLIAQSRERMNG